MIDVDRDCERMRDFLAGRLTGPARHRFERRLVRDRSLVADLELVAAFREGLSVLRRQVRSPQVRATARSAGGEWLFGLSATAALLAVVVVLAAQVPGREILTAVTHASLQAPHGARTTLTFTAWRPAVIAIDNAASPGLVELRVRPGVPDLSARFDLALERPGSTRSDARVAAIRHLTLRADGFIHCYADFTHLAHGRYELVLRPESGSRAPATRFPIEVVPPARSAAG